MDRRRMKILLSAYSCGPGRGSEPGVGWNAALALADLCEVHVLTTHEFKADIERLVADGALPPSLHFHFYDIPGGAWWWKHGKGRGIQLHYALWQRMAGGIVRSLHRSTHFDAAQHVTLVRYWSPSCLRHSGIPYVFGPVAGADLPPEGLVREYPWKQQLTFLARKVIRWLGEHNPATRATLRNATHVFAATPATQERCLDLGVPEERLSLCQAIALGNDDIENLSRLPFAENPVFFGMGLLIHRKRYDLALRAFAKARIPQSRLILIGGGPLESDLRVQARNLGIDDRLEITGFMPRLNAWKKLAQCAILLHPCDLESGGCVIQESLAAGRPVIALNMGGPAMLIDESRGCKVAAISSNQIVEDMATAMRQLSDLSLRVSMFAACKSAVRARFCWKAKAEQYVRILQQIHADTIKDNH